MTSCENQQYLYRGEGFFWEFLVVVCARFSKSWPYFRPKNVILHTRFQTWPFRQKWCYHYVERKPKYFSNPFRIYTSFFLFHLFGIETINTFIHSHSSIESHTRFQTKMGKVCVLFQAKTAQKPYPMRRHNRRALCMRMRASAERQ